MYYRGGEPESQCAQSSHAEEAGDLGELSAGGGGGPCTGSEGRPVSGRTDCDGAHPAAPEPPAALSQPVGSGEGAGMPVPGTRLVHNGDVIELSRLNTQSNGHDKSMKCENIRPKPFPGFIFISLKFRKYCVWAMQDLPLVVSLCEVCFEDCFTLAD